MVGEGRPAEVLWLFRLPAAYGQSRVQHEHTALRPLGERAVLGRYNAEITLQLLEDVLQASEAAEHPAEPEKQSPLRLGWDRGYGSCPRMTAFDLEYGVYRRALKMFSAAG